MKKRFLRGGWWLLGVALFVGAIVLVTYEEHNAAEKYKARCAENFSRTAMPVSKKNPSSAEKCNDPKEYLPWWYVLLSWPEGIAGWIVIGTGFAIVWQGWETRRAADATKGSVVAIEGQSALMKRQANAMDKQNKIAWDRERAQLIIQELDNPELFGPSSLSGDWILRVRAFVENVGSSRAFSVKAYGMLDVRTHSMDKLANEGFLQSFPQIIEAREKFPLNLGGFGREYEEHASTADYMAITPDMAKDLRDGKMFIYACGILTYEDIFGECHTTPFRFVWHSIGDDDGRRWPNRSFWMDTSDRPTHTYPNSEREGQNPN